MAHHVTPELDCGTDVGGTGAAETDCGTGTSRLDPGTLDAKHPYPTDFGQTDFGQTDFGQR